MIDVVVVTHNRLPYIQKCLWSLIANTDLSKVNIHVYDAECTDGTTEFLAELQFKGLIKTHIKERNRGSAGNLNYAITKHVKSEWFVRSDDDMWFREGWFDVVKHAMMFQEVGICSFFDYTRFSLDKGVKKWLDMRTHELWDVPQTGLGCCAIWREVFDKVGGFRLPSQKKMGFFGSKFCGMHKQRCPNKPLHLAVRHPVFALHMDLPSSPLNSREYGEQNGYNHMRHCEKNNIKY